MEEDDERGENRWFFYRVSHKMRHPALTFAPNFINNQNKSSMAIKKYRNSKHPFYVAIENASTIGYTNEILSRNESIWLSIFTLYCDFTAKIYFPKAESLNHILLWF